MKRKFSKILGVGLTLALLTSLLVTAVPVAAQGAPVTLRTYGNGTAEWSTDYARTGSYSLKLFAPATTGDYGIVVMPLDMEFEELADFSVYVEGGATAQALPLHDIKAVVDDVAEVTLPASNKNTGAGVDLQNKIVVLASQPGQSEDLSPTLMSDANDATWEKYGTHTDADINVGSGTEEYWSIFVYSASYVYEAAYDYYTWDQIHSVLNGKATVTEVRVELRYPQGEAGDVASTVYVDDIEINGVTYDLEPRVINTGTSEGFNTIQDAIDDVDTVGGHTISVAAGTYTENIVVDKSLIIQGAAGAIIDGEGTDWVPAVKITATGVTLQGFTIQNFKADASNDWGAVFVQGDGATIQGNTIHAIGHTEPEPFGIGIDVASNNVDVIGNTVYDTGSIGIRVYGPFGGTTTGVLVENNVVYHTGNTGVVFANTVSNSTIRGNHLYDSLDPTPYNLFLCWGFDKEGPPNNILIEGNTISGGYGNIVLAGAEYITITGNTITGAVPLATNGKNIYILDDYLQGTNHLSTNIVITNNDILGAEGYGVRIAYTGAIPADGASMASTTTINNNNIYGNTDFGVENTIETIVNATSNWWGAADGPSPTGSGDLVSDFVDFTPWLYPPTVVTAAASSLSTTSATLNGSLDDLGNALSVDVSFEWGFTTAYGNETTTQEMTSTGTFTASLTGLSSNTTYHFIVKAVGHGPDVYGDDITFTTRAEPVVVVPPPAPPAGTTDVRGDVDPAGVFLEPVTAISEDELCTLDIPEGTVGLTEELEPLDEITMVIMDEPPAPPEDAHVVGLAYDFGPDGATFDPPITLTWSYDPDALPEGVAEKDLVLAYYDEATGEWVVLEGCVIDTENNTITASIAHFTTFAIIGVVPVVVPLAPAVFIVSSLGISPSEVAPSEEVNTSVLVANTGGESGSYTVVLKIDGVKEAEERVTVAAGGSQTVTFSVTKEEAGSYTITVDGLSSSFAVVPVVVPPEPAAFSVSYLSVSPRLEVEPGETVTITVMVANTGGESGSYTVVLKIDGVKEAEETVTVAAGDSQDVSFSVTKEEAGSYTVTVDGLSGSFTVVLPIKPPGVNWPAVGGGIAAGVIVIGLLIFFFLRRRAA